MRRGIDVRQYVQSYIKLAISRPKHRLSIHYDSLRFAITVLIVSCNPNKQQKLTAVYSGD